ncbi:MAG: hypothetical protein OEM01_09660 [Desulfobulbaceae bacterium]|nr:hypothetical protein [Desulfobulbaceae bacterium]
MVDEQVKKIIDKTFSEVEMLVKEVLKKKRAEKDNLKCSKMKKGRESHLKKT